MNAAPSELQRTAHDRLEAACRDAVLLLDGAMGTMIQRHGLGEAEYRGERFADWSTDLKGNNDLLVLTQPAIIEGIHKAYLDAGSDIVETNTFNAQSISMADYAMEALSHEINVEAAKVARRAVDASMAADPTRQRFVAGAIGPTNRTASISPDVDNPGYRNTTFEALRTAYKEQALGLIEGGCDCLLIETIFDTLNAKAAGAAVLDAYEQWGIELPLLISGTITDLSGRNLSGQTPEAFAISMQHLKPFAIGLNCAFGAEQLRGPVADIGRMASCRVIAYPNAGLPNELGEYDETPEEFSGKLRSWASEGLVNIMGGCCGSTPEHVAALRAAVQGVTPRVPPHIEPRLRLSGLEPFVAA